MGMAKGVIRFPQKPVSVVGCNANWLSEYLSLVLTEDATAKPISPPFFLYRLSYMYYTALGCITAIIVGLIVSYLTGNNKEKVHEDLLSPIIYRFIKEKQCNTKDQSEDCKIPMKTMSNQ